MRGRFLAHTDLKSSNVAARHVHMFGQWWSLTLKGNMNAQIREPSEDRPKSVAGAQKPGLPGAAIAQWQQVCCRIMAVKL